MSFVRLLLALLLLAAPTSAFAQTFPPLTGRVVDAANLLSPEQEAQLTQRSAEIEKASSRQFVVATIPDLQGYPIEDFGYKLGSAWKIGQSEANNGIILIVAPNERLVRIEVGKGLEPIMTDGFSGLIIDNIIIPKFRAGDMAGGIMAGAAEIAAQMELPLEAAEARAKERLSQTQAARKRGGGDVGGFIALFWVALIVFIVLASVFGRRRRGRRYHGGGGGLGPIILWSALNSASRGWGSGGGGGSSWGGGGGFGGGFSGGGGSFGGGGASGSW